MLKKIISVLLAITMLGSGAALADGDTKARTTSDGGVALIEKFEGFSATRYLKNSIWYIGYGTSCSSTDYPSGISQADADKLLRSSIAKSEASINNLMTKNNISLTQNQFDALVSFTYNLGAGWMSSGNRIYDYLTKGITGYSDIQIVNAIGTWCHIGSDVSSPLVVRRIAEAKLFLYNDYNGTDPHTYNYIVYDPGSGSVDHDIVFYESGKSLGTLPTAAWSGHSFSGWYTGNGKKLAATDVLTDNMSVFANWNATGAVSGSALYSDVSAQDWFYYYVSALNTDNVIGGYPDGSFKPANAVTCGEALKLILLAAGYDAQPATDTNWASGYLKFAVDKGFVASGDITNLDAAISRLQLTQIAAKALELPASKTVTPFSDTADGYVLALYDYGIITGSNENGSLLFKPQNSIIRSEIIAIVWRMKNTPIHVNKLQCGSQWVDIVSDIPTNKYDVNCFYEVNGVMQYSSESSETQNGIDVSEYQGDIDWAKVKASGVNFAILRVGYRGSSNGAIVLDKCFLNNIKGATAAGMDIGVYFFSQAITADEAKEEANFVLTNISGYKLKYPVVFDWEPMSTSTARTNGLDTATLSNCATAFCGTVKDKGYTPMVYFNASTGYLRYDLSKIISNDIWFAGYTDVPSFYYNFQMWQYSSSGKVDGISGNVDMDICFKAY